MEVILPQLTSMKISKWWIIGGVTVLGIALAILVAEHFLKNSIKEKLQIQTTYGDTLRISKVDLGLLRGWIDINDLVIRWNLKPQDTAQQNLTYLIQGKIGKVQLEGLSFFSYLFKNQIRINRIAIDSSSLDLHLLETAGKHQGKQSDRGPGENDLTIYVKGMEIEPSRIRYFFKEEQEPRFEVAELSLNIDGFQYPQTTDSSEFINHFNWRAENLRYTPSIRSSDLLVSRSSGDSRDSSLQFSHLRLHPRYSKAEYSQHLQHKDSRVDIVVAEGRMTGVEWQQLFSEKAIRARKLQLDSCVIEVYEDSRLPVDETRYKSLYQEKLLKTAFGVTVDTTQFRHGALTYEMRPDAPEATTGFLNFLDLDATLLNLTNDRSRIAERPLLRAQIDTRVNGHSELKAYFTFDLSDPDYAYSYSGEMRGFDLSQFNTMLMQTSQMKIAEGEMQKLSYRVNADKRLARGEMRMDYSGLKIEWLEQHNRLAALAQKIVMREQNPKNGNYRVGQIYHLREPHRSFWNCYLKSLLSGLNSTAMPNLFLPEELDAKKEKIEKK